MRILRNGRVQNIEEPLDEFVIACMDRYVAREVSLNIKYTDADLEWLHALATFSDAPYDLLKQTPA